MNLELRYPPRKLTSRLKMFQKSNFVLFCAASKAQAVEIKL